MKRILITGANGYIGARLSQVLSQRGYILHGVCYPNIPENIQWQKNFEKLFNLDLTELDSINKLTENSYDVNIHLVSLNHFQSEGDPGLVSNVNLIPTWNLLKKFNERKNLDKFIYFSTIQVYGTLPIEIIDEKRKALPQNAYGLTHHLSENVCEYFNRISDIHCCVIRLSNSYGSPLLNENDCWWLVVNDLCKTAYQKNEIILQSDGSPQRDFIHSSDLCDGVELVISKSAKEDNNIYQLSSGKTRTIGELAEIVKKVYNERYSSNIEIDYRGKKISFDLTQNKYDRYIISNDKLKRLGFYTKTDLQKGINEVFDYLEKKYEAYN